jgi:hypothetical protein
MMMVVPLYLILGIAGIAITHYSSRRRGSGDSGSTASDAGESFSPGNSYDSYGSASDSSAGDSAASDVCTPDFGIGDFGAGGSCVDSSGGGDSGGGGDGGGGGSD